MQVYKAVTSNYGEHKIIEGTVVEVGGESLVLYKLKTHHLSKEEWHVSPFMPNVYGGWNPERDQIKARLIKESEEKYKKEIEEIEKL